jgi:hypothetical protein
MGYDDDESGSSPSEEAPQTAEEAALRFRIMKAGFNRFAAQKGKE